VPEEMMTRRSKFQPRVQEMVMKILSYDSRDATLQVLQLKNVKGLKPPNVQAETQVKYQPKQPMALVLAFLRSVQPGPKKGMALVPKEMTMKRL
jgi:hypothetical protein